MKNKQNVIQIALIDVEDILFISNSDKEAKNAAVEFLIYFEGKCQGKLSWYLGIYIEQKNNQLKIGQES